jgi:pantoate--beta-alanine ligase
MIEVLKSKDDLARLKWDVLVPTMGALHAGHQSLIKLAKGYGQNIVVSIFVNPLQFENKADLNTYPKTIEADIQMAEDAGALAVFAPSEKEIYPGEIEKIDAGSVGNIYEGATRSGHFSGVLTVVKRLFDLVMPKYAVFGEKDFQQLFLIKEMVRKLQMPVKIISAPTIRDVNNLALSSRNIRLTESEKQVAHVIYKALSTENLQQAKAIIEAQPLFKLDYLNLIDEKTFADAQPLTENKRLIIAGWVNQVRLIDNKAIGGRQ